MTKFILPICSQTLDKRVEGGGEKLQTVEEAKITDLELENFSDVIGITSIELSAY